MPTPDFTFNNTAPVLIGEAGGEGVADVPVAVPGAEQAWDDGAPAAHALPATAGIIDTPRARDYWPAIPTPTDPTMQTPALTFAGQLILDQTFGLYRAPQACVLKQVQLAAQVAPLGADAVIELVDAAGDSLGVTATLAAGESWSDLKLITPLPLAADAIVRGKVTQVGSDKAGSFLTATLIIQLLPV
jgi:hypothetical protein